MEPPVDNFASRTANQQLYLAIGVPMLFNAAMLGLFTLHVNTHFDDMRDLWRAECHLEERR